MVVYRTSMLPRVLAASRLAITSRLVARQAPVARRCFASEAKRTITMDVRDDGIAIITMDQPGPVNVLNRAFMDDFQEVLKELEGNSQIKAAILKSKKSDCWIAGADITMLAACKSAQEATELSAQCQQIMEKLRTCKRPVIAAINGSCLGGGLETAINCTYRIATTSSKTILGVPEVMLGILPGGSGTQRLPQLIGLQPAMDMCLTGKQIKPSKAKSMGLVDLVCDPNALDAASVLVAKEIAAGKIRRGERKKNIMTKIMEDTPVRQIVFNKAGEMLAKATGGNYPAPPAILECIKTGWEQGTAAGLKMEHTKFGTLALTPESKALKGIFFGQTACKKNRFGKPKIDPKVIGILGAGLMGAGIAQVSLAGKYEVVLKDKDIKALGRGIGQVYANLDKKVRKKSMPSFDRDATMSRMTGLVDESPNWQKHIGRCDLMLEAVFENLGLKHKVIQEMEQYLPEHAVFATNTSALPINKIAEASKRPERIIGMHYFSPVDKMPLLEIITHPKTDKDVAAMAVNVGLRQGKTVIVVKDVEGFYVNRCLGPYMTEGIVLLNSGIDMKTIDNAMKKFGFPIGPIGLCDEVGIDVAYHVQVDLEKPLGVRMAGADKQAMDQFIAKKLLGRKTGKGFYSYEEDPKTKKQKKDKDPSAEALEIIKTAQGKTPQLANLSIEDLQMRMCARFVNEAAHCLMDEIVANPSDADIGAVFGIGFPPFRGGPFRMLDIMGCQKVVDTMNRFADQWGEQFRPASILVDYAKAGKKFHNDM